MSDVCAACAKMRPGRRDLFHNEGLELVAWYEGKPGNATVYPDARIAAELGWFPSDHSGRPTRAEELQGYGDGKRVRNLRRSIDRCSCLFDGYAFGTKSNGSGGHVSRLNRRDGRAGATEIDMHVGELFARGSQAHKQHAAERERDLTALMELRDQYRKLGDFDKFACTDHAIRDYEEFNQIQPSTYAEGQRLGIPIPRLAAQ